MWTGYWETLLWNSTICPFSICSTINNLFSKWLSYNFCLIIAISGGNNALLEQLLEVLLLVLPYFLLHQQLGLHGGAKGNHMNISLMYLDPESTWDSSKVFHYENCKLQQSFSNKNNLGKEGGAPEGSGKVYKGCLPDGSLVEVYKGCLPDGSFVEVYKGCLPDGSLVAVKRIKDVQTPGGELQFQTEVEMISMVVHRNLLRLCGFCMTPPE